jgi:hypothetical protein
VNDCPLQFIPVKKRTPESHTIQTEHVSIKLKLRGVISYFNTRKPTAKEIQDTELYPHIEMTSLEAWDPYSECLGIDEHKLAISGNIQYHPVEGTRTISQITTNLRSISMSLDDDNFLTLIRNRAIISVTNTNRKGTVTAQDLADKWFIGLNSAQRTLEQSTQRGVRDFATSEGSKRMKHTAHQLMFRHIRASVYTDTMFNKVKSLKQNTCA